VREVMKIATDRAVNIATCFAGRGRDAAPAMVPGLKALIGVLVATQGIGRSQAEQLYPSSTSLMAGSEAGGTRAPLCGRQGRLTSIKHATPCLCGPQ
jgi:hypothetical protein